MSGFMEQCVTVYCENFEVEEKTLYAKETATSFSEKP